MGTHYSSRLLSNFIALSIIQGTNFLLPILVMPFVIKRVGADGFGIIAVAQVVMIYLSTISDYGFNLTATRDVAINRDDKPKISRIFYTVLASKLLITVASFLVLLIMILFVPLFRSNSTLYLLGFTYVLGQSLMVCWFFQGMEKMQYITVVTLLSRVVFVLLVFAFIRDRDDKKLFLLFLGLGNTVAGLLSIYLAHRIFGLTVFRPRRADIRHELKEGWQITLSNLSINTYLYINVFVLRLFTNDLTVGYYSIAEKIFFAIRQILGIYSQVIYPRVCQVALQGRKQVTGFFKEIYLPFLALVVAGCCIVFFFSGPIVMVFLGSHSTLAVLLLRLLAFVPVIVCLNIPAYQVLLALNHKKNYLRVLVTGTMVNLAANLALVNIWGAVGTAIAIIITELFITTGLNAELYKKYY